MSGKTPARKSLYTQKVPLNVEFVYVLDGEVVATVEWRIVDRRIRSFVYAPSGEIAKRLPAAGAGMGARIKVLRETGVLFPARQAYEHLTHCYRIVDGRPGRGHRYLIWTQPHHIGEGPKFQSGLLYHFQQEHAVPPYDSVRAVLSLRDTANALLIKTKEQWDALKAKSDVNLDGRVVIWDMGAMHRD